MQGHRAHPDGNIDTCYICGGKGVKEKWDMSTVPKYYSSTKNVSATSVVGDCTCPSLLNGHHYGCPYNK